MATLASKKSDALSVLVAMSLKAEAMARDLVELKNYFTDNGFLAAGPNAVTDADCVGANGHLTAALVNAAVTAIATMKLNNADTTTLRQVALVPTLPAT